MSEIKIPTDEYLDELAEKIVDRICVEDWAGTAKVLWRVHDEGYIEFSVAVKNLMRGYKPEVHAGNRDLLAQAIEAILTKALEAIEG